MRSELQARVSSRKWVALWFALLRALLAARLSAPKSKLKPSKIAAEVLGPCISANCTADVSRSGFPRYGDPGLCSSAYAEFKQKSFLWLQWSQALQEQSTCKPKELQGFVQNMFGDSACAENDLCTQASTRLSAWEISCDDSVGPSHLRSFCRPPQFICPKCQATKIASSLACHCATLVSDASRSGAVLQMSWDERYVVKRIKKPEMDVLVDFLPRLQFLKKAVLNYWSYLDSDRLLVVMPNAYDAVTNGLRASWVHQGFHQGFCNNVQATAPSVHRLGGWDIKPLPVNTSAERAPLLAYLVRHKVRLQDMLYWDEVTNSMRQSLRILSNNFLVDYSLLLAHFRTIASSNTACRSYLEMAVSHHCVVTPACKYKSHSRPRKITTRPKGRQREANFVVGHPPSYTVFNNMTQRFGRVPETSDDLVGHYQHDYSEQVLSEQTCDTWCVTIADYLMPFTIFRSLESHWKQKRWHKYAEKTMYFWNCLGNLTRKGCKKYLALGCRELSRLQLSGKEIGAREIQWCIGIDTQLGSLASDESDEDDTEDFESDLAGLVDLAEGDEAGWATDDEFPGAQEEELLFEFED